MKHLITAVLGAAMFLHSGLCQAQAAFQWAQPVTMRFGGRTPDVQATTTDAAGNVYSMVASTDTAFMLGGTTYRFPRGECSRLIKFDPAGSVVWMKRVDHGTSSSSYWMRTDVAGNLYMLGSFYGNTIHVDGPVPHTVPQWPSTTPKSYFIAKWNAAGVRQWVTARWGDDDGRWVAPTVFALDEAGNTYLSGFYQGTDSCRIGPFNLGVGRNMTIFCAKYSPAGVPLWAEGATEVAGTPINCLTTGMGLDAEGSIYLTGEYEGSFAWRNLTFPTETQPGRHGFWLKLDMTGQPVAHRAFSSRSVREPTLTVAPNGDSFLTIIPNDTLRIGSLTLVSNNGGYYIPGAYIPRLNPAVVALDPHGNVRWAQQFSYSDTLGHADFSRLMNPVVDRRYVYLAGYFGGTDTLRLGNSVVAAISLGRGDTLAARTFVTALDRLDGHPVWFLTGRGRRGHRRGLGGIYPTDLSVNGKGDVAACFTVGDNDSLQFGSQIISMLGTANLAGGVIVRILQQYNTLTGAVFVDANANGFQDPGEGVHQQQPVVAVSPGSLVFSPDPRTGAYDAIVELGAFSASLPHPPPYHTVVTTGPASTSFSTYGNAAAGRTFALQPIPNQQDLQAFLTIGRVRPGRPTTCAITYRNVGTVALDSGEVSLAYDRRLTYQPGSQPPTGTGPHRLAWRYVALQPNQTRFITAHFMVDTTAFPGDTTGALPDTIRCVATVLPLAGDLTPVDNEDPQAREVTGSLDPNALRVSQEWLTPQQAQVSRWLDYTVDFQNVGSDTAFSVVVRDTLPGGVLDVSSLQVVTASHPFTWSVDAVGALTVRFPGIRLPHQRVDEAGSSGFVRFRVRSQAGLTLGDEIRNRAHIRFDFNAPLPTNEVVTRVTLPLGEGAAPGLTGHAWPNPVTDQLHIAMELPNAGDVTLRLLDGTGRLVYQERSAVGAGAWRERVSTGGLPAGLYLLDVQAAGQRLSRRIVIR